MRLVTGVSVPALKRVLPLSFPSFSLISNLGVIWLPSGIVNVHFQIPAGEAGVVWESSGEAQRVVRRTVRKNETSREGARRLRRFAVRTLCGSSFFERLLNLER